MSENTNKQGKVFIVYAAGAMFSEHELNTNILIKDIVWKLSGGKYYLVLPQSMESNISSSAVSNRDHSLLELLQADLILARFDGLELDSGTAVEFTVAKTLGKPAVILRSDYRLVSTDEEHARQRGLDEPYNLMVKSWPRTVEVHIQSLPEYISELHKEYINTPGEITFESRLASEMSVMQKSLEKIAKTIIRGLDEALQLESPFPQDYRELVYQTFRYAPGESFCELLGEEDLQKIINHLKKNGSF